MQRSIPMSRPAEQIRFCTSRDGVRIAYATCGSGPPLVWVAHWVHHLELDWNSLVWRPWLLLLTRRHTLIRYDMRGCGLSDQEGVEFSFEKFVEDLEAVIEAANLEQCALFGTVNGSAISMAYAVRHPNRVSHLVLYASYVRNRLAGSPTPWEMEEAQARLKVIELGWPNDTPAYGQFFTSLHMPDASAEQFHSFNELVRRTTCPANAVALLQAFFRIDAREIVPKVRCPTLVLHARGDSIIPFEAGRSVARLIPGARFVPLESRNHVLVDNEPAWQQFAKALDEFLPAEHSGTELSKLTPRERDLVELIAQGLDNAQIAARLDLSEKTVRNYVTHVFAKLQVENRPQAIVLAREAGFGRKPR
jgi:pimeloyl-ACP methyl ester carboxylesterase